MDSTNHKKSGTRRRKPFALKKALGISASLQFMCLVFQSIWLTYMYFTPLVPGPLVGIHHRRDSIHSDDPSKWDSAGSLRMMENPAQNSTSNTDNNDTIHIFHHVFLPPATENATAYQDALAVVDEQMNQIMDMVKNSPRNFHLHYTTVGTTLPHERYCRNTAETEMRVQCTHSKHYDIGFEEYTLQALYDHCQAIPSSPNHDIHARVVYLHSKGTFHNTMKNQYFRRALTKAALHPDCLKPNVDQCNVCGLHFIPFPIHMAGNMWTASCDYVRHLIPPLDFRSRIETVAKHLIQSERDGTFQMKLSGFSHTMLGTGRYSNQHWIATNPAVVPCQVGDPSVSLEQWRAKPARTDITWQGRAAPVLPLGTLKLKWLKGLRKLQNVTERRREITLLPGLQQYWDGLYQGRRPGPTSWFWDYYPDGDYFRALAFHDNQTVKVER